MFPNCKILAFEADRDIFKILRKNIELFDYDGVDIQNVAVWNENTQLRFSSDGALGGKISSEKNSMQNFAEIKAIKLSEHLTKGKIDFLKIDIEGSEFTVLNSCRECLSNVDKLFVEYHSDTSTPQMLSELLQIIKDAGFRYYIKEAWENMKFPYIDYKHNFYYDMQLNIFCYR
jgi:FkbM family methyltransferase